MRWPKKEPASWARVAGCTESKSLLLPRTSMVDSSPAARRALCNRNAARAAPPVISVVEMWTTRIYESDFTLIMGLFLSRFTESLIRSEEHTSELQSRQYLVCR